MLLASETELWIEQLHRDPTSRAFEHECPKAIPHPYNRGFISNIFKVDETILEKTLEFVSGELLQSS